MISKGFFVLVIVMILLGAFNERYSFNGVRTAVSEAGRGTSRISQWLPGDRINMFGSKIGIIGDPVYLDLPIYRHYDQLEVEMTYRTLSPLSIGLRVGEQTRDLQMIDHPIVPKLLRDVQNWSYFSQNDIFLFQRKNKKQFSSIEEFLTSSPADSRIGTINYKVSNRKINQAGSRSRVISRTLRGSHTMLTYVEDEPFYFRFKIQDINRQDGADPAVVQVYFEEKIVAEKILADDGAITHQSPASAARFISLDMPEPEPGIYKIVIQGSDDIVIREISTRQSKLVFVNHLYLIDNEEYKNDLADIDLSPTDIYTDSIVVKAYTSHYQGLQTLQVDTQKKNLNITHRQMPLFAPEEFLNGSAPYYKIISSKNDLKLTGKGVFALSQEQFFSPSFINLDDWSEIIKVDYVLAKYVPPTRIGDWSKSKITFDIRKPAFKDKVRVVFSAPQSSVKSPVLIDQVKVTLKGRPWRWSDVYKLFQ